MALTARNGIDLHSVGQIANIPDPTNAQQASTKTYADTYGGKRWIPAATRAIVPNENQGATDVGQLWTTAGRFGRTMHRVIIGGAQSLRLEYANWANQNGDSTAASGGTTSVGARPYEISNSNSVSYRASIEYPAGVWKFVSGSTAYASGTAYALNDQVVSSSVAYVCIQAGTGHTPASSPTFWTPVTRYLVHWDGEDGTRAVVCAGGSNIASVPVAIPNLTPGTYVAVNSMVLTGGASNFFIAGDVTRSKDIGIDYSTTPPTAGSGSDPVDSGVTTQTALASGKAIPMPFSVSGIAAGNGAVALLGDSIMYSLTDTENNGYLRGAWASAMEDTQVPHIRLAQSGSQSAQFLPANAPKRLAAALNRCSAAICHIGVNDIPYLGAVTATIQANMIALWTALDQRGMAVWQDTIFPSTTSTDSFATKANQSTDAGFNTCRQALNAWLRTGATWTINGISVSVGDPLHPLTGVLDLSLYVEDPTDSSKWLSNGSASYWTTDGIHPSPAAYASLEATVKTLAKQVSTLGSGYPFSAAQVNAIDVANANYMTGYGCLQDGFTYGDVMSTCPRYQATTLSGTQTASTTKTYVGWIGSPAVTAKFSTVRLFTGATNASAITVGLYKGVNYTAMIQQATGTVTSPTTVGEKDVTLGNTVICKPGEYLCVIAAVTTTSTAGGNLAGAAGGTLTTNPGGIFQAATGGTSLPSGTVNLLSGYTGTAWKPWFALA